MSHNRTPLHNPLVRRFSQVYVEIPPSPLHRSRSFTTPNAQHVSTLTANRKENAPLRASNIFQAQTKGDSTSPSRKRKLSESDTNMTVAAALPSSSTKKAKLAADVDNKTKSKGGALANKTQSSNISEEFPNGFFYCHQCSKKRDAASKSICPYPYVLFALQTVYDYSRYSLHSK